MLSRIFILLFALSVAACKAEVPDSPALPVESNAQAPATNNEALLEAFSHKRSNVFLEGTGLVKKLLPDDNKGSRHQKFLVGISSAQTLLFAHNIDLAPRINGLQVGDTLSFRGEYVYNPKGGVMHWTHKDPQSRMQGGWIKHNGKTYE